MKFFWCVIGVVLVLEGIPWFLSPQGLKRMLVQMLPLPERTLRMMGLMLMLGGLLIVYYAVTYYGS
ncbi:DUF2065 domain-containing protein [Desulfuromonas acetoxidans]|nr:DUF2065 domain-containing protein [Desulfuromonas acetoxidans]MBF0644401.1 DUF2065 domain-containing protein [Desulfuromonas acetoxidans]NVD23595.1 DUF2065 domain-containing protein [Desulfuromonas acetoxidans]NVE16020.1 DUF2065 domain-containing protein [Desulfuromonas acetoxidans]